MQVPTLRPLPQRTDMISEWQPFAVANGGILSFCAENPQFVNVPGADQLAADASANIHLPTAALHASPPTAGDLRLPPTLPVGSLW